MHCPQDNTVLLISERQGVEIDYCPQCRGVWLDRGELDKLIEKTSASYAGAENARRPYEAMNSHRDPRGYTDYDTRKKRKSSLSDIFDF